MVLKNIDNYSNAILILINKKGQITVLPSLLLQNVF